MTTEFVCPYCSSPLDIDETAEKEIPIFRNAIPNRSGRHYVEVIRQPAIVAFCTGCEFTLELPS